MRSLDFDTRSSLAKECISRVCKATGLPVQEANRKVDHRILKMLADQVNLTHTGKQVNLNITSASLNLTVINSGEVGHSRLHLLSSTLVLPTSCVIIA